MKTAATVITFIFHPLLLTTYLILFLGIFFPAVLGINPAVLYTFALSIFIVTFIFPTLCVLLMMKFSGTTSSLLLSSRRERILPFILIAIVYVTVAAMFFYHAILGMNFNKLMMIIAALVVFATVITFFYKISVHSLAMGGFIGILLAMNRITDSALVGPTVITILIAGQVMSSRLLLNAHTTGEVMIGALTGFVVGLAGMIILF